MGSAFKYKSQVGCFQRLKNRAIYVTKCLKKYDLVSQHCQQLNWLPTSHQIKFKSVCAMYRFYHHGHQPCMFFNPPIVFGAHHFCNTCCKDSFVDLLTCRLTTSYLTVFLFICFFMVELLN